MAENNEEKLKTAFYSDLKLINDRLISRGLSEDEAAHVMKDLGNLKPESMLDTVFSLADDIKISDLKQNDPNFTEKSAAVRGYDKAFSLGAISAVTDSAAAGFDAVTSDKTYQQSLEERNERERLLTKAFPKSAVVGEVAGFVGPGTILRLGKSALRVGEKSAAKELASESAAGAIFSTGSRLSQFGSRAVKAFQEGKEIKDVATNLKQGLVSRVIGTGVAAGAYEGGKEVVTQAREIAAGEQDLSSAVESVADKAKTGVVGGATFETVLGAGGFLAKQAWRLTGNVAKGSARLMGGKDIQYQLDNVEAVRQAIKNSPEQVFSSAANDLAPIVQKAERDLVAIENESKDFLVKSLENKKLNLSAEFQKTAEDINQSVAALRQAAEKDVASSARTLASNVDGSFRQINKSYGQKLDEVVSGSNARVDLTPALDRVETLLKEGRSLTKDGRLLPDTPWAKANPELFEAASDLWVRLGGEARNQGGSVGTRSLQDALNIKKQLGELANFGERPNFTEKIMRDVYRDVRVQTERADKRLVGINQEYAANRSKLDTFRSVVGKNELQIATKLRRDIFDNKNIFVREGLEALGELGESQGQAVKQAISSSDRLKVVSAFKRDPKQAFNQLVKAYQSGDALTAKALESAAAGNPQLQSVLRVAKNQGEAIAAIPKPSIVQRAVGDSGAEAQLQAVVPEARSSLEKIRTAQRQREGLTRELPASPSALESRLSSQEVGATPVQREAIAVAGPGVSGPLKQAEAARVAERLLTGKGIDKTALENLPAIGDLLYSARKQGTALAARLINRFGKASPATRKEIATELINNVDGVPGLSQEQLRVLASGLGAEQAIIIYGLMGGKEDILQAADRYERQFEEETK